MQLTGSAPTFLANVPFALSYCGHDARANGTNNVTVSVYTFDLSGNGTGLPSVTYDFGGESMRAACADRAQFLLTSDFVTLLRSSFGHQKLAPLNPVL